MNKTGMRLKLEQFGEEFIEVEFDEVLLNNSENIQLSTAFTLKLLENEFLL